jgi:tetratricopeptide (TPR) repeat protein
MFPALLVTTALVFQAPAAPPPSSAVAEAYFLFIQSRQLEDDGKVAEAIAALRKAVALVPRNAEVQAELAGVYAREGRAAEAVTAAEGALALEPKNREAHRTLGLVKAAVAGDPSGASSAATLVPQAIRHLEEVLSIPIIDLQSQLVLSRLYAQTGQHAKVLPIIKAFLEMQPGYPEALLLLGDSAEKLDRWEDAAAAWAQVSEMGQRGRAYRGRLATALVKLGDQHFDAKRYREAVTAFDRALAGDRTAFDAAEVTRKRDRARELAGK